MAFSAMFDALFRDPNIAQNAVYTPQGGEGVAVRVVQRAPDITVDALGVSVHRETGAFEIRVSEVAQPVRGDTIVTGGRTFTVQGAPVLDDTRLVWVLEARPS
jgi:hypothetical protein